MHLIMYTSQYTGSAEDMPTDVSHILTSARTNNPNQNITGVLFFDEGKFIQVLEGEDANIHELLEDIKKDSRHQDVKVLMDQSIDQRELDNWNMRAFNLTSTSNKDWSLLDEFRDIYLQNFKVSSTQIIRLLQRFIEDSDSFERFRS